MQEFAETLKAVEKIVQKSYAYMNNHANAQAVTNAIQLKEFLGEPIKGDFNPDLVKRYPQLKKLVSVADKEDVVVPAQNG